MNNILIDDETGHQYMLQPSVQELESGIIQYVPELHAHLWDYILVNGQLYSNHPDLIDWDQGVRGMEGGPYGPVAIWHSKDMMCVMFSLMFWDCYLFLCLIQLLANPEDFCLCS